jgi:hypothetical protein
MNTYTINITLLPYVVVTATQFAAIYILKKSGDFSNGEIYVNILILYLN